MVGWDHKHYLKCKFSTTSPACLVVLFAWGRGWCRTNRPRTFHGPYHTRHERDNAAEEIRRRQQEDDGLFWADVNEAGTLAVGPYTAGFFWQESGENVNLEWRSEITCNKRLLRVKLHFPLRPPFRPPFSTEEEVILIEEGVQICKIPIIKRLLNWSKAIQSIPNFKIRISNYYLDQLKFGGRHR